jgi:hypothetical protein
MLFTTERIGGPLAVRSATSGAVSCCPVDTLPSRPSGPWGRPHVGVSGRLLLPRGGTMLKALGIAVFIIFLIGLLVVIGVFDAIL